MYEIKIYQDQNGRSEIEEYLKSLSIRKEFVLLSVFIKRTQKTPRNEIIKAKKLLKDFLKRGNWYE